MRLTPLFCLVMVGCVFFDVGGLPPERNCGEKGATPDGHRCNCDRDCRNYDDGAFCFAEYQFGDPGGVCAHDCEKDRDCGDGYACVSDLCRQLCTTRDDCERGRHCVFDTASSISFCRARCDRDFDCDNRSCNLYSGECNLYGQRPRGAGLNGACKKPEDCRSRRCLSGRCITYCDPSFQRCPDDGVCVDGICMSYCAMPDDCAPDQSCIDGEHGQFCAAPSSADS